MAENVPARRAVKDSRNWVADIRKGCLRHVRYVRSYLARLSFMDKRRGGFRQCSRDFLVRVARKWGADSRQNLWSDVEDDFARR